MSKSLFRIWKPAAFIILVGIAIAFTMSVWYGISVLGSIALAEAMIGVWIKHGLNQWQALGIAVICGNFDTLTYFVFFGWLRSVKPETIQTPWRFWVYRKACGIGRWLGHLCVPEPDNGYPVTFWHYLPLPLYGFWPGCMMIGINYAMNFRLQHERAFPVIAIGNTLKMAIFLKLAIHLDIRLALALLFIFSYPMKKLIEATFRKFERWSAKQSAIELTFAGEWQEAFLP